ncbi:hypothetical protein EBME_1470 [bacterium endosymbiont of Mortierella elongata FMR23-6]|nr:hypothetical protein EBME_1470 [bacterium endosymbiont of Mortierella elongata FMR23-6]
MLTPINGMLSRSRPVAPGQLPVQTPQQMLQQAEQYIAVADGYKKSGQVDEAEKLYQAAQKLFEEEAEKLSLDPQSGKIIESIYLNYGLLLNEQGRRTEAETLEQKRQQLSERYRLNNAGFSKKRPVEGGSSSLPLNKKPHPVAIERLAGVDASLFSYPKAKLEALQESSAEAQTFSFTPILTDSAGTDYVGVETLVQSCHGTINAPVQGKNNTVNVHYYSPVSEARQPHTVSLDRLRNALYQHYQLSNLSIQRVSGETASLEDCYINLAIVESQAQREKDKKELEKQAATFERLPSSERQRLEATNPNKMIALEKLFDSQKLLDGSEGVPKRILIQGRAGIGKTTLCKKLVYEYHENGFWQDRFESVLWVPLRQLKTHAPKRVEDLLCTQYFAGYESSQAQALSKVFYTHQDKTLFILDGLDEVVDELHESHSLSRFLKELLTQTHVVITSRPAGVNASLFSHLDLELETVGFSPDNVQAYIKKFAPESNQAAIERFIHCTPMIQGLVNIPIQLDALCYSWDKLPNELSSVTMASLYEAMVSKLWWKDGERLEKGPKDKPFMSSTLRSLPKARVEKVMASEIYYLGYLAFKGLETGKIEFSSEELDQYQTELENQPSLKPTLPDDFTINLKKTSFLHTFDAERLEADRYYHFLHLTFQEFFAAKYLVRHLQAYAEINTNSGLAKSAYTNLGLMFSQAQLEIFIAIHKYNPRYEIMWWMVAGLLKGDVLQYFFDRLEKEPLDLIGIRHQQVMMGCLNEARPELKEKPEIVEKLETRLKQHFDLEIQLVGQSQLGRHRLFPEHLLITTLNSDKDKDEIIKILRARPNLSANAIHALLEIALKDRSGDARKTAARILDEQKTLSTTNILQTLIGACQDQDKHVRSAAARALGSQSTLSDAALRALSNALQDQDSYVRSAAARALGGLSTLSEVAVLALSSALQDQDKDVRDAAAYALGGRSTLSEAAILALIGALQDQDKDVRDAAARALGGQSTLSEVAILALIGALQDQDKDVRDAAARVLRGQSTLSEAAVRALIGALQDQDKDVRDAAASALGGQNTLSEAAVLALIGALQNQDKVVRSAAAWMLGSRTLSEAAVQALTGALKSQDKDVRGAAARALGGRSTLSEAAILALIGALQDQDKDVRDAAVRALGGQSTLSEAAILALIGALQDQDKGVMSAAASALGSQSTLSEATMLALIGVVQDQNSNVRSAAVHALRGLRALSAAAVQALIGAVQDQNKDIRSAAAWALGGRSTLSEAAMRALIGTLQDQDKDVRSAAAGSLGNRSTLSGAAMQALIGVVIRDQDNGVRSAAASALRSQSTLSDDAALALIGALQNKVKDVRGAAARAIGGRSTLSEAAILALIGALQDQDKDVRSAAARALGGQSTLSEAAILALIGALQDQDSYVRSMAAHALRGQSVLSAAAVLALNDALQDQDSYVRSAAACALGGKSTLSDNAVLVLIDALKNQDKNVRDVAAKALKEQQSLPAKAIQALITGLKDRDKSVRDTAVGILDLHIDQIYLIFASLVSEQIQTLYAKFLFPRSGKQMMFLYVQGNKLYFHTKSGLNHIELASPEKMNIVIDAFKAVRNNPDLIHFQESISINTAGSSGEMTNESDTNRTFSSNNPNPPQSKSSLDDVVPIPDSFALIDNAIERNIVQGHVSDSDESYILDEDSLLESESESADFSEEEE